MKKLLFASACVATVAAFGDEAMPTFQTDPMGFESIAADASVANKTDTGADQGKILFYYESKEGSTDGSTVKAYGVNDNLPVFDYQGVFGVPYAFAPSGLTNDKYLELSTEGGTLWRSAKETGGADSLGDPVDYEEDLEKGETIYVDTMVQFTPTEDGGAPTVNPADQLAIWLNVATDADTGIASTNLCVLAAKLNGVGNGTAQTFVVPNKDQDPNKGFDVVPGKWYRLTVKTFADLTDGEEIPGFMIYLDGKLLVTGDQSLSAEFMAVVGEEELLMPLSDVINGSVFASLWTTALSNEAGFWADDPSFSGVGFKGSGALDDLCISSQVPNFLEATGSLDFTLTWGEGVSAVFYTIGDGTKTAAVKDEKVDCPVGATVKIEAEADDWYVIDSASVADLTVAAADTTRTITASLAATPADAEAAGLDGVTTADAKAWADAKGLTPAQITASTFALNAYLMNTDLSAAPGLQITSITEVEGGWQITVKGTQGDTTVSLAGINGQLNIKAAATLEGLAEAEATPVNLTADQFDEAGVATITVTGDNKNFMKVTVGVKASAAE